MPKIAFFGTPPFTTEILDALHAHGYTPSLIVTGPDKAVGRGLHIASPAPKLWAEAYGITVIQPEKLTRELLERLSQEVWDLFIVVAYGKILPQELITMPKHGTLNIHYSLLPKYRGATPVESAILSGDSITGVCIQQMVYTLDAGDILASQEVAILPEDTTPTLRARLNTVATELLIETLPRYIEGAIIATPQDSSKATHCKKIKKEDGQVTLTEDPLTLDKKYRAYTPWPGLYFFIQRHSKDVRVKIKKAHYENDAFHIDSYVPENMRPLSEKEYKQWLAN